MSEEKQDLPSNTSQAPSTATNLTKKQIFLMVGLFTVLAGGFLFYNLTNLANKPLFPLSNSPFTPVPIFQGIFELKQFTSAQEFQSYLDNNRDSTTSMNFGMMDGMMDAGQAVTNPVMNSAQERSAAAPTTAGASPDRVSGTNVQVLGIDEPDIVKTNGSQLFVSSERTWFNPMPVDLPMMMRESSGGSVDSIEPFMGVTEPAMSRIAPDFPGYPTPVQPKAVTQVLTAFPPAQLAKLSEIDVNGQLLLNDKNLVVLGNQNGTSVVTGFDVSNAESPKESWQVTLSQNNQLVAARMMNDKLYVITQTYLYNGTPCPYIPLIAADGQELKIACSDIYYPSRPTSNVDSTFTSMIIDPGTGAVEARTSLVGSGNNSVIYVSPTAIYLTYQSQADMVKFMSVFLAEKGTDLFPSSVTEKLSRLDGYDISNQAKMLELQSILESHQRSLGDDERLRLQNELQNRIEDYMNSHSRELEQTLITKLNASDLQPVANGGVPGSLLGQFSMDEYQGNLRVATTFGQQWTQFGQAESASDVYVLDSNLRQRGVVTDLGQDERIYAVRFIADKGYVVTFKQIDPFYILDLTNPDRPVKTGELKIPGYSSYLHPLSDTKIVGIGKEENRIKISLFDVSDDTSPKELSKYQLDEYWSELLNTHHAFLLDAKHQVFFMPGSKGGYVFSYQNDQLKLVKAISQNQVQRALFINDYLYVIGEDKITVLNENDWQSVKELSL